MKVARWRIIIPFLVCLLLATACRSPGEAACRDFQEAVDQMAAREINVFQFSEKLGQVAEKGQEAEPDIARASANLSRAINTVSNERIEVAVTALRDACIAAGYLEREPAARFPLYR